MRLPPGSREVLQYVSGSSRSSSSECRQEWADKQAGNAGDHLACIWCPMQDERVVTSYFTPYPNKTPTCTSHPHSSFSVCVSVLPALSTAPFDMMMPRPTDMRSHAVLP